MEFFHDSLGLSTALQVSGQSRSPDQAAIAMKNSRQMKIKATVSPRGVHCSYDCVMRSRTFE